MLLDGRSMIGRAKDCDMALEFSETVERGSGGRDEDAASQRKPSAGWQGRRQLSR